MVRQRIKVTFSNSRNKGNAARHTSSVKKENNIRLASSMAKNYSSKAPRVLFANATRVGRVGQAKRNNGLLVYKKAKIQTNTSIGKRRRKAGI